MGAPLFFPADNHRVRVGVAVSHSLWLALSTGGVFFVLFCFLVVVTTGINTQVLKRLWL